MHISAVLYAISLLMMNIFEFHNNHKISLQKNFFLDCLNEYHAVNSCLIKYYDKFLHIYCMIYLQKETAQSFRILWICNLSASTI